MPVEHLQCIRPRCRTWHAVTRPAAAREGDLYVMSYARRADIFAGSPVRSGDVLVYLVTDDVRAGDFVALLHGGKVYAGFLAVDDGRWLLTDAQGEPREGYFEASTVAVVGRCVEVQRAGRVVDAGLRPAHASQAFEGERAEAAAA